MAHAPIFPTFLGLSVEDLERFGSEDSVLSEAPPGDSRTQYQKSRVRNLFGPLRPGEMYRGMRVQDLEKDGRPVNQQREATVELLEKVVQAMRRSPQPGSSNANLPAGYTYLLQFMAHDIVQNIAPPQNVSNFTGSYVRDFRSRRMELDTLYGGGPHQTALPYATEKWPSDQRHFFRLSKVPPRESMPKEDKEAVLDGQPARDIGRVTCPFLSSQLQQSYQGTRTDALIADIRNDDNVIISQLTALFQTFHNLVLRSLLKESGIMAEPASGTMREFLQYRAFLVARLIVGHVYRDIVLKDVLCRLLNPGIFRIYRTKFENNQPSTLDRDSDLVDHVPVEFSHGVFRFGHFMVQDKYLLNATNGVQSTGHLLDRTGSGSRPDLLPLACDWLVDWSRFFFSADEFTKNPAELNASKLLLPDAQTGVLRDSWRFPNEDNSGAEPGRDGGLFFRDLIRGAEGQLRTVTSLLRILRSNFKGLAQQLQQAEVARQMETWLGSIQGKNFSKGEVQSLTQEPPLLLYILVEASTSSGGERLGPLGSIVTAEVFFGSLESARANTSDEKTIEQLQDPNSPLSQAVFPQGMPSTMKQLVDYVVTGIGSEWHHCP